MSMSTTKKNNNNKSNNNIKTYNYCKKKGYLESNCFKKYSNLIKNKSINNTTKEETILTSSVVNKDNSNSTIDFILDSSATIHTCYIKELFINIKPSITTIKQGNTSNNIKASGVGDILVKFTSTNKLVKLTNVLYVPQLGVNLLSLSLITKKNYSLSFNKDNCFIYNSNNNLLSKGYYKDRVSIFSIISSTSSISKDYKSYTTLNTINNSNLEDLEESNLEDNLEIDNAIELDNNSNLENNSNLDIISNNSEQLVLNNNTIELLHNRLGHINLNAIKKLKDNALGVDFNLENISTTKVNLDNYITYI